MTRPRSSHDPRHRLRNPRSGKVDYQITPLDLPALTTRTEALHAGQAKWLEIGLDGRIRAMEALCDAVDRHYRPILDPLCADTGRHEWSVNEIEGLKGITRMRCASAAEAMAEATGNSSDPTLRFQQQYVPYQLVGIISPWNYPLILAMIDAICALLAGSAVAIKPSEGTPRFIAPFRKAIAEVEHLRDVLDVFEGGAETGGWLVDLTDTLVFTGSVPTGRKVRCRHAPPASSRPPSWNWAAATRWLCWTAPIPTWRRKSSPAARRKTRAGFAARSSGSTTASSTR
nr:aldehyde dehydrogenase family protein [Paracoccus versutus]